MPTSTEDKSSKGATDMISRRSGGSLHSVFLSRFHRDVGDLFGLLSQSRESRAYPLWRGTRLFPRVNVRETSVAYIVRCEIPGVKAEDLDMKLDGDTLILKGRRKPTTLDEDTGFHRRERAMGEFGRCLALPGPVNQDKIEATYRDGVLMVTLVKRQEISARKVDISTE